MAALTIITTAIAAAGTTHTATFTIAGATTSLIDGEEEPSGTRHLEMRRLAPRLRGLVERLTDPADGGRRVAPQSPGQRRLVGEVSARKFGPERLGREQRLGERGRRGLGWSLADTRFPVDWRAQRAALGFV